MSDLMKYLPPYYHDCKEMIYLTDTENSEIDLLWKGIQSVHNNQFILEADEARIRQWEKLLRIRPDYENQSLEFRKQVILMRLSTKAPITQKWLEQKTESIVGKGNYIITVDYENYWLRVRISNDYLGVMNEYKSYLRETVPANLGVSIDELCKTWGEVKDKYYGYWGCWHKENVWEEQPNSTWSDATNATWYECKGAEKQGGVLSSTNWWDRILTPWDFAKKMTWKSFYAPNSWQDIKNYVWE